MAKRQTKIGKRALDILQTLLAQAFDSKKIILSLADQASDGADRCTIKYLLDTCRKIELTDAGLEDLSVNRNTLVLLRENS